MGRHSCILISRQRQSLARMMEYRSFKAKEIRQITSDLVVTMTALERFLMDGDQLCLEPDMIYVDPDDLKANFCLLPGSGSQFEESFRKLARYILDHVDHTDGDAVVLAFALFRAGEKENLGDPGSGKMSAGGRKRRERRYFQGKTLERKRLYEAERKNGQGEYGTGAAGRAAATSRGEKQNGSEAKVQIFLRIKKTDLSGRTEKKNWQRRKGLKHGKNLFSVLFSVLMAAVPVAVSLSSESIRILEMGNGESFCGGRCADGRRDILVKKMKKRPGKQKRTGS